VSVGRNKTIMHAHTTSRKTSLEMLNLRSDGHLYQNVGRQGFVNVCWMIPKLEAAGQSVYEILRYG
jgi:hypothetical protein